MKKPPAGQGPFQRGERLTAAKLNDVVNAIRPVRAGGRAGIMGDAIVSDETETAYIRVTGRTGANYSWTEVYRTPNGTWANGTRSGNATYDWAIERNNATVTAGLTVYEAKRSPDTSEWIFDQGGSGGNVNITSGETVLMILGDYDTYKDCPNVPASPPTAYTDYCNGTRGTELCVPAFAYAVYQRCGYVWNKVGDTRDFGVWANELNGQSFSAWRRFVIPRWGGDIVPATGLPDPASDCMGVAFLGTGTGSALTCSCPSCLLSPPPDVQLCVKFRTPPRPCPTANGSCGYGCGDAFTAMDDANAWDKEFIIPLTKPYCGPLDSTPDGLFTFEWQFGTGFSLECDWGPDVFDPCDPCSHWGVLFASLSINAGNFANCGGAGIWRAEYKASDVCNLLCDCSAPPLRPRFEKPCNGCDNGTSAFHFVISESIELVCCPTGVADSAMSLPDTVADNGSGLTLEDQTA